MPRLCSYRRSMAAKKRMLGCKLVPMTPQPPRPVSLALGTGRRHRAIPWPISTFTRKQHKLVIPDESPNKKFVLLVGDSHLRSFAHGFAEVPADLSLGVMSTPGACAKLLRTEVLNADVPRAPDVVVLMAPSNNLTATTANQAGKDFRKLLGTLRALWHEVVVVDFPPRRHVEMDLQEFLREQFRRVAASAGIRYCCVIDHFPLHNRGLWCRDGVHLSDNEGMPILANSIWSAAHDHLQRMAAPSPPTPDVSPKASPPARNCSVGDGNKRRHSAEPGQSCAPKRRIVHQQVTRECFIQLRFSREILAAMDASLYPSHLPSPTERPAVISQCRKKRRLERQQEAVSEMNPTEQQVTIPKAVKVSPTSPARALSVDAREKTHPRATPSSIKAVAFLSPVSFSTPTDAKGKALCQSLKLLSYYVRDEAVPRYVLYKQSIQTCREATRHMAKMSLLVKKMARRNRFLKQEIGEMRAQAAAAVPAP